MQKIWETASLTTRSCLELAEPNLKVRTSTRRSEVRNKPRFYIIKEGQSYYWKLFDKQRSLFFVCWWLPKETRRIRDCNWRKFIFLYLNVRDSFRKQTFERGELKIKAVGEGFRVTAQPQYDRLRAPFSTNRYF